MLWSQLITSFEKVSLTTPVGMATLHTLWEEAQVILGHTHGQHMLEHAEQQMLVLSLLQSNRSQHKEKQNASRTRFSNATDLNLRDHVAHGFVHLLQSTLPLLGPGAIVVAFHVDALVVHSCHFSTAIAGSWREDERMMHVGMVWEPSSLSRVNIVLLTST